jgi:hypothetical protein
MQLSRGSGGISIRTLPMHVITCGGCADQVVERLYRLKWGRLDGLGALIISPTRELAMQIFDELRKIGHAHDLSAGLLIGGKNVKEERERVNGEGLLVSAFVTHHAPSP